MHLMLIPSQRRPDKNRSNPIIFCDFKLVSCVVQKVLFAHGEVLRITNVYQRKFTTLQLFDWSLDENHVHRRAEIIRILD